MSTTTSDEVLKVIKEAKIELPKTVRTQIEKIIYDALVYSYTDGKRVARGGCDCGQMSCPECHG